VLLIIASTLTPSTLAPDSPVDRTQVVTVEDSNDALNYVAVGICRYNNFEVAGNPAVLEGCPAQYSGYRQPFSAGALLAPEATCWGENYAFVDTAGYYIDENSGTAACNRWTQPIKMMGAGAF
jgi:hypothetical protein